MRSSRMARKSRRRQLFLGAAASLGVMALLPIGGIASAVEAEQDDSAPAETFVLPTENEQLNEEPSLTDESPLAGESAAVLEEETVPVVAADEPVAFAAEEVMVPAEEMSIAKVSSQMPPYPSAPAVDGTAEAVLSDDMNDTWVVEYTTVDGVGYAVEEFPHWLVLDLGKTREITQLIYDVKNTVANPKDVAVYTSVDGSFMEEGAGNNDNWGDPVATTVLQNIANSPQHISFDAVQARYVKFEAQSGYNEVGKTVQASYLRVMEIESDEPVEPTEPPEEGDATPFVLTAHDTTVKVAEEFPQIISYQLGDSDSAVMNGNATVLDTFNINGTNVQATTEFDPIDGDPAKAKWVSTLTGTGDFAGLEVTSTITVEDEGVVKFRIESIEGKDANSDLVINQISIPNHSLISVNSSQQNAYLARTLIHTDRNKQPDRFIAINASTPTDSSPVPTPYGFVWTDELSAGLHSNATLQEMPWAADEGFGNPYTHTNARLSAQVTTSGEAKVGALQSGSFVWAPKYSNEPCNEAWLAPDQKTDDMCKPQHEDFKRYETPEVTIVVTETLANDRGQGWQSGAVALRDHIPTPLGAERVPERVVQRIPFNIGSEATNPFLKTLDNTKRISQATDGLGQFVLLKGYGSEGHDSANTDYSGNYNDRAGGLKEMNQLIDAGVADYNADFAVHVNDTEAYAHARSFNDWMTNGANSMGWGWLNQSYYINQTKDIGSGDSTARFRGLKDDAPNLAAVYIDVWYSSGWLPEVLAGELDDMGFEVASEWSYGFEGTSTWSHWANDRAYGGSNNKGISSHIARFMFNTERDVWSPDTLETAGAADSLFGSSNMKDFEGWTSQNSWTNFIQGVWEDNLPTKYVQHFPILEWNHGVNAKLENNVEIYLDGKQRVITQDGKEVLRGSSYLLPWSSELNDDRVSDPLNADKMYFYSKAGGTHTFDLTAAFDGQTNFVQHELTGDGRGEGVAVSASNGQLTLTGSPGTAYVVVPAGDNTLPYPEIQWGEYTNVKDPGFNATNLDVWNPTGDATREFWVANQALTPSAATGDPVAQFGAAESSISQTIRGLEAGEEYMLSSLVEIEGAQERDFKWSVTGDGLNEENAFNITPAKNWTGAEPKRGDLYQTARVKFIAPADGKVVIQAWAAAGDPKVRIDDVRIQKLESLTDVHHFWSGALPENNVPEDTGENGGVLKGLDVEVPEGALYWDFEDNVPSFGPFVRGDATGHGDARTSISVLHYPYSQQDWKNQRPPFNSGALNGTATDDVLEGAHSLKVHNEYAGWIFRTIPARVNFKEGHDYRVSFSYQSTKDSQFQWILGRNKVGSTVNEALQVFDMPQALETTRFEHEFTAGCGSNFVGLKNTGGGDADFTIDQVMFEDLGESDEPAACGATAGSAPDLLAPGGASRVKTTFTNQGDAAVTNVGMSLGLEEGASADGWKFETEVEGANLFNSVAPGQTVTTTWLVTPPENAGDANLTFQVTTVYADKCEDRTVTNKFLGEVSEDAAATIPVGMITATASSQQPGEGPGNALQDTSALWHSDWNGTTLPGWYQFNLSEEAQISGVGYLPRQEGGNGKLKGFDIEVSTDGNSWTKVHEGEWQQTTSTLQTIEFEPVNAKYVRMKIKSVYRYDGSGTIFMSAQRLVLYGSAAVKEEGFDPAERPATEDSSCVPDGTVALSGTLEAGQELTASVPAWDDWDGVTYQWFVAESADGDRTAVEGATDVTFALDSTHVGKYVSVDAALRSVTVSSRSLGPVAEESVEPAVVSVSIAGDTVVGETLTAEVAGCEAADAGYQWFVADAADGEFAAVGGATEDSLVLAEGLAGQFVRVEVACGDQTATSEPVGPVTADEGPVGPVEPGVVSVSIAGDTVVGETLSVEVTGWDSLDGVTYQWFTTDNAEREGAVLVGEAATLELTEAMVGDWVFVTVTRGGSGLARAVGDPEVYTSALVGPVTLVDSGVTPDGKPGVKPGDKPGGLPKTGAQIALFTVVGSVLLAAGIALTQQRRRKVGGD